MDRDRVKSFWFYIWLSLVYIVWSLIVGYAFFADWFTSDWFSSNSTIRWAFCVTALPILCWILCITVKGVAEGLQILRWIKYEFLLLTAVFVWGYLRDQPNCSVGCAFILLVSWVFLLFFGIIFIIFDGIKIYIKTRESRTLGVKNQLSAHRGSGRLSAFSFSQCFSVSILAPKPTNPPFLTPSFTGSREVRGEVCSVFSVIQSSKVPT